MEMRPLFFATPVEWRRWLARHHETKDEVWVGFRKKASGQPGITWPEAEAEESALTSFPERSQAVLKSL
jgi:uncharacterized protein YdeI (YjbR/CyaY-like superfamily)